MRSKMDSIEGPTGTGKTNNEAHTVSTLLKYSKWRHDEQIELWQIQFVHQICNFENGTGGMTVEHDQ